jgi:hypothetical protein
MDVLESVTPNGGESVNKSVYGVRGLQNPDQSYSRTSLVRMTPIGVGGDG